MVVLMAKNLPSGKEEWVKAYPSPEGDGKQKVWSTPKTVRVRVRVRVRVKPLLYKL